MKTKETYATTRIWLKTLKKLRLLHAKTGKSIVALLESLVDQKLREVEQDEKTDR